MNARDRSVSLRLYSNRSAAQLALQLDAEGLADALKARSLKPSWNKASYRVGLAYMRLKRYEDAGVAFFDALKLDPNNQTLKDAVKNAVDKGREEHQQKTGTVSA